MSQVITSGEGAAKFRTYLLTPMDANAMMQCTNRSDIIRLLRKQFPDNVFDWKRATNVIINSYGPYAKFTEYMKYRYAEMCLELLFRDGALILCPPYNNMIHHADIFRLSDTVLYQLKNNKGAPLESWSWSESEISSSSSSSSSSPVVNNINNDTVNELKKLRQEFEELKKATDTVLCVLTRNVTNTNEKCTLFNNALKEFCAKINSSNI